VVHFGVDVWSHLRADLETSKHVAVSEKLLPSNMQSSPEVGSDRPRKFALPGGQIENVAPLWNQTDQGCVDSLMRRRDDQPPELPMQQDSIADEVELLGVEGSFELHGR